jgi:hypothetical protein
VSKGRPAGASAAKSKKRERKEPEAGDNEEWEVEAVVDERLVRRKVQYLLRWANWDGEPTWTPLEEMEGCDKVLAAWQKKKNSNEAVQPNTPVPRSTKKKKSSAQGDEKQTSTGVALPVNHGLLDGHAVRIQNIVARGRVSGKKGNHYLVEWGAHGSFAAGTRTFEPLSNLNCDELIADFEESGSSRGGSAKKTPKKKRELSKILGAKELDGAIVICCQFKGESEVENLPHSHVATNYPQELIKFYSTRVKFIPKSANNSPR